jgi:sensor histidine kinase YesM
MLFLVVKILLTVLTDVLKLSKPHTQGVTLQNLEQRIKTYYGVTLGAD